MITAAFDKVCKNDIERLLTSQEKERRTLEYKEQLPGGKESERKEFLADVSSFANAAGGDILFGVKAKRDANGCTGAPESIPGLLGINTDAETQRLESMIRDGIKPRIAGIRWKAIDGFANGPVLLGRIQKSFSAPHMITFQDWSRFYSRNNTGKYPLDVAEIRSAFALSESLSERVRRFRDERISRIIADECPVLLPPEHIRFVLHVLPATAFDFAARIDIALVEQNSSSLPTLVGGSFAKSRFNLDGYLTHVSNGSFAVAYAQVFRTGIIESVEGGLCRISEQSRTPLHFSRYENFLIEALKKYIQFFGELDIQTPVFVLLTIIGVRGLRLVTDQDGPLWPDAPTIDREVLILPDVVIEDYAQSVKSILRPIFDAVWQAGGRPRSPNYDC